MRNLYNMKIAYGNPDSRTKILKNVKQNRVSKVVSLLSFIGLVGCSGTERNTPYQMPVNFERPEPSSSPISYGGMGSKGIDGSVAAVTSKLKAQAGDGGSSDLSAYHTDDGQVVSRNYYTANLHLYFRISWLCKQISIGRISEKFPTYIKRTRTELDQLTKSSNKDSIYTLMQETVEAIEEGMKHYLAGQEMYALQEGIAQAPWNGGESEMQAYIDRGGFGIGGKEATDQFKPAQEGRPLSLATPPPLSPSQQRSLDVALKYAAIYHASPADLMKVHWKRAVAKSNSLREKIKNLNYEARNEFELKKGPGNEVDLGDPTKDLSTTTADKVLNDAKESKNPFGSDSDSLKK